MPANYMKSKYFIIILFIISVNKLFSENIEPEFIKIFHQNLNIPYSNLQSGIIPNFLLKIEKTSGEQIINLIYNDLESCQNLIDNAISNEDFKRSLAEGKYFIYVTECDRKRDKNIYKNKFIFNYQFSTDTSLLPEKIKNIVGEEKVYIIKIPIDLEYKLTHDSLMKIYTEDRKLIWESDKRLDTTNSNLDSLILIITHNPSLTNYSAEYKLILKPDSNILIQKNENYNLGCNFLFKEKKVFCNKIEHRILFENCLNFINIFKYFPVFNPPYVILDGSSYSVYINDKGDYRLYVLDNPRYQAQDNLFKICTLINNYLENYFLLFDF